METVEHAFLLCDWVRATWFGAECQSIPTRETVTSIGNWLLENIRKIRAAGGEEQEKRISNFGFLMWEIWKTRNDKLFQHLEINPMWTIKKANIMKNLYWKLKEKQAGTMIREKENRINLVRWRPPPTGWLKANVDAAFRKEKGSGAISVVVRDNRGRIVLGFTGKIQANSSIAAEATAIRQAIIIVNNLQMGKTLIESDNLKLIQAIKSKGSIGKISAILQDINMLMEQLPEKGLTWTPRNGNFLAHEIAKAAEIGALHHNWSTQPPANIHRIIRNEIQFD
ncbi:uncharacterized protein LOC130980936 [Arachis stenosperma]|uniref:uncharacterized protein LOC130980936 n=1 Tax=Arachis stenosperma TaxID=217475 RepID=UPI0025ACFFC1|nr:uncharacterized protein LOC130980936 [Arachis stenosperma]